MDSCSLWCHRFWQSFDQGGRHTKFSIIGSLKRIVQICSKCYCWVSKILLSTQALHIVVWGKLSL